jgi:hypothetical protein
MNIKKSSHWALSKVQDTRNFRHIKDDTSVNSLKEAKEFIDEFIKYYSLVEKLSKLIDLSPKSLPLDGKSSLWEALESAEASGVNYTEVLPVLDKAIQEGFISTVVSFAERSGAKKALSLEVGESSARIVGLTKNPDESLQDLLDSKDYGLTYTVYGYSSVEFEL